MIVYIDESKDDQNGHYVLAGYLTNNESESQTIIKLFKDAVRKSSLGKPEKAKINQDIKESYLHRSQSWLLSNMINFICFDPAETRKYREGHLFAAACYDWPSHKDPEFDDVTAYCRLLLKIVDCIMNHCKPDKLDIIFDSFKEQTGKDEAIVQHAMLLLNQFGIPVTIEGKTGQSCNQLYIADIAAGTCRRQLLGKSKYFHMLKPLMINGIDLVDVLSP